MFNHLYSLHDSPFVVAPSHDLVLGGYPVEDDDNAGLFNFCSYSRSCSHSLQRLRRNSVKIRRVAVHIEIYCSGNRYARSTIGSQNSAKSAKSANLVHIAGLDLTP